MTEPLLIIAGTLLFVSLLIKIALAVTEPKNKDEES